MAKKHKIRKKAIIKPKPEAVKHAGGRPRRFSSPEEMAIAVEAYFLDNPKPTMCGLAIALGFLDRTNLYDYEGYSAEFFHIIKSARIRVEKNYEERLQSNIPTGSIFALKNMKWHDSHDVTSGGKPIESPAPVIQIILTKSSDVK